MGGIESKVEQLLQRALMPKEAPSWYADRPTEFPEAPANSLLFLSHVCLQEPSDSCANQRFYTDGLGANLLSDETRDNGVPRTLLKVGMGACQLHFSSSPEATEKITFAQAWPGHLYCWVDDTRATLRSCEALEQEMRMVHIVEEVHNNTGDDSADALELQDPACQNHFIINAAPPGSLADKVRAVSVSAGSSNVLAILDATHHVPPGSGQCIARFYKHFFQAAVNEDEDGQHALVFALGPSLQQTLTFVEDDSAVGVEKNQIGLRPVPGVCIYMPSLSMFEDAFKRCAEAGLLHSGAKSLEEATNACEFCVRNCVDPSTEQVVLELFHFVRLASHPECTLAPGLRCRPDKPKHTETDAASNQSMHANSSKFTLGEVAKHNTKADAWIALNGQVLDVTRWIDSHPGGARILMENIGTDVSDQWNMIHAEGTLERKLSHPRGPIVRGALVSEHERNTGLFPDSAIGA